MTEREQRDPRPYRDGYAGTPVALENPMPVSQWSRDEPTPGEREAGSR